MAAISTIPSYAEWTKKTTLGVLKPRSTELKSLDVALKQFEADRNGTALKALALAWNAWKRTKPDWKASERNTDKILEQLNDGIADRLGPLGGGEMSESEKAAMVYMDQQRRLALQRLFKGKKVKVKFLNSAVEARRALSQLKTAGTTVGAASGGASGAAFSTAAQSIKSMLSSFFDVSSFDIIAPFLLDTFGVDLVASMVPVVGHIKSAASVLVAWGDVGKSKYDQVMNRKHKYFVASGGDMEKAFEALDQLLTGEIATAAISAGMKTTSFTAKSLLVLADGGAISGPVIGAAEALANLTFRIYQVAGEYKETRKANLLLDDPENLDFKLFDAYPLLGCYMLVSATLSDVMNMSMIEFGGFGWMDDVESIKKRHIDPVRKKSFELIDASMFEVDGLSPLVQASKLDKAMKIAKAFV